MTHVLHTVVVSYQRLSLLRTTVETYLDTVTLPFRLVVVDNGSDDDVTSWLQHNLPGRHLLLEVNRYPGYAANRGFEWAHPDATLLHRSDNDMEYIPGWCDEVVARFDDDPRLGQLGLRTLSEEGSHSAVGGNCVIRRELWDRGLRYGELPWSQIPFEDSLMSQRVLDLGWNWRRVERPCTRHLGEARRDDPYYQQTFAVRGITFDQWGIP